ncbi:MAG: hypothetical protein A2W61_06770 [Deltaproteobacteria bacterium RIFCSPLOWO2_01_44_7]|nr:MAG: hypothetical protein A2712_10570 [Deltaproteobacteria bacterium RIFCSPHIGHO2_01_FULL_43_49]OGQ15551.1 MAG: hypothetical protein A3D22_11100 [Deltaproteobacteria bacterium RIFCSPHIGHO2_02_FULL_44_53]OGQ28493.1 MAG: hypothetical protein A3D98_03285 [Deltaproteobacteria bacterium RIFCSPHIGHO2_12_FULL_44_21]OGQ32357.1 MAG: hypothetical protein A2979_00945 [Deltaproteobacteria bacterium RIFCSPLOWO2_01_FULL_45_74]OGQ40331.1 MAG: hypothetical protein A2W61_06770 [Deltaproteobacteria bacterium 
MKLIVIIFSILISVPDRAFGFDLASQIQELKLSNGMIWLIVHRPQVPVFSGIVMIRAGGADEVPGKTGLAHMFEHMAFKGSKKIGTRDFQKEAPLLKEIENCGEEMSQLTQSDAPDLKRIAELKAKIQKLTQEEYQTMKKNEVWEILSRKGAEDLNAFTAKDVTAYHASMPVAQFPLWASVTSEMVFDPIMREFYQERDVVMEERRLRYDNSPNGFLWEVVAQEAFPEGPYHWSTIGHAKDLVSLTMKDAALFHSTHYTPQNMVGVLVGDLSRDQARATLEKYFGKVPARKPPKDISAPDFSFKGEKRKTISFPAEPSLVVAFHKPKAPQREDYIFDMLDGLLCEGRTGRLYQKLVKELKIASTISCAASFPGSRQNNLFVIYSQPINGHSLEELEKAIHEELQRITTDLQPKELEKVRAQISYNFFWSLASNSELAEQLAIDQAVIKDWKYVVHYPKIIETISIDEIKKTAKHYFTQENRVIVYQIRGKRKS